MSYLQFKEIPLPDKKTKTYQVINTKGEQLGSIQWSGPWRKYVFHTFASQYDVGCLTDIINFINQLMDERKILNRNKG